MHMDLAEYTIEVCIQGKWYDAHMEMSGNVPDVKRHLFSVQQATKHGVEVKMTKRYAEFFRNEELVAVGSWRDGTYIMSMRVVIPASPAEISIATETESLQLWHERLGHQNKRHVRKLLTDMGISVSHAATSEFCDGCALGKAHRKPFKSRPYRAMSIGEIINADVNGPMSVDSFSGARYYVCFKDDYSKYRRIFFLKKKSDVSCCLRTFLNEATNLGHVVKSFRCDGGGEFDCGEVQKILAEKGIALTLSVPYTPEQNGAAERENQTIVELARSMLATSALPRSLWDTAVYLLNHTGLSPDDSKSPHELWTGEPKTKLDHLKVFGTECYAHVPKIFRSKFEDKSVHGHFVGYVNKKDGYKIYLPSRKKIIKSRDVDFKPERLYTTPVTVEVEEDLNERYEETRSKEPLSSSESDLWLEAMKEEIKAFHENETWELVERPKGSKVINCRWVLRKKFNSDGTVERHKARLVAKGYAQKAGFDYDETFSPVARYDTVRAVLAVAAKENLYLQQSDVKTAFLYGTLKEEVFMTQPEGFNDNSGRVCKLHKSLYGLKQAPRCWNRCFVNFMKDQELKVSTADPCLFIRHKNDKKLLVVIYVDDGLAAGTDKVEVEEFMSQLGHSFQITRGSLNQFLDMNITRLNDGSIFVNQCAYLKKVLSKFHMDSANSVSTPSDKSFVFDDTENKLIGKEVPYRQAVGSLMYLATATRPDLAYAISIVSENLENPRTSDWCAVKRIFKYLRGTVDFGLLYQAKCHPNNLEVYSDADYAEAEYVAASESAKELIWLKHLLSDITNLEIPSLLVDNASAVKLAKNPEYHKRSKHIDVRYHFVREKFIDGELFIKHVPGEMQLADIMTKPLPSVRFKELRTLLGLLSFNSLVNEC
ncbi:Copia protein like [Argiope bruennichi]|uniref:Copia protein like n=1 Tax=Argiope bruennichi TaxID=94029 RepID=A0A8T0ERI0_ARGBR|nr:Copia protein like [Argiope bruennichi]